MIGKMFDFNDETIRKKLKEFGIKRRNVGGVKIAIPSKEQLEAVYPKLSIKDAGQHFNVGQTLMLKWLNLRDIPTTKKHRRKGTSWLSSFIPNALAKIQFVQWSIDSCWLCRQTDYAMCDLNEKHFVHCPIWEQCK
jgi:hypothetical protein